MTNNAVITITGTQMAGGESDVVELTTTGSFYEKNNKFYIIYDESEATGFDGTRTTVKVEAEKCVTMSRSGNSRSQLIIENGVRHQCSYDTGYGHVEIGVSGDRIKTNLGPTGGEVDFKYSLDISTALTSEHMVNIKLRMMEPQS